MSSSFMDSLMLALSDSFEIPDSKLKRLSGILIDSGLSDSESDLFVVNISSMIVKYDIQFPVSISYLKEVWNTEYTTFKFTRMVADMVKGGYFRLRKMSKEDFFSDETITKTDSLVEDESDLFVSINITGKFKEIFTAINEILQSCSSITESVGLNIPSNVTSVLSKVRDSLRRDGITLSLESFTEDDLTGNVHVNLVLGNTSKYSCKDSDVLRVAKKYLSKCKSFVGVEAYIESDSELFVGLDLKKSASMSDLPTQFSNFMEDMEMNMV